MADADADADPPATDTSTVPQRMLLTRKVKPSAKAKEAAESMEVMRADEMLSNVLLEDEEIQSKVTAREDELDEDFVFGSEPDDDDDVIEGEDRTTAKKRRAADRAAVREHVEADEIVRVKPVDFSGASLDVEADEVARLSALEVDIAEGRADVGLKKAHKTMKPKAGAKPPLIGEDVLASLLKMATSAPAAIEEMQIALGLKSVHGPFERRQFGPHMRSLEGHGRWIELDSWPPEENRDDPDEPSPKFAAKSDGSETDILDRHHGVCHVLVRKERE